MNGLIKSTARCEKCKNPFPSQRYDMGYKNCTECSAEPKWSAVPIINHKTGNEVQIVKDPEDAAEFLHKSARVGFGTMRGMSSGYKRKSNIAVAPATVTPDAPPSDRVLSRKALPNEYPQVGAKVMAYVEAGKWESARAEIQTALEQKRIFGVHSRRLTEILDALELNGKD
jgi:hypothetical protein